MKFSCLDIHPCLKENSDNSESDAFLKFAMIDDDELEKELLYIKRTKYLLCIVTIFLFLFNFIFFVAIWIQGVVDTGHGFTWTLSHMLVADPYLHALFIGYWGCFCVLTFVRVFTKAICSINHDRYGFTLHFVTIFQQ